jgi:hypothetical protein
LVDAQYNQRTILVEINSILLVQNKEKERNNKRVSNHETNIIVSLSVFAQKRRIV